MRTEQVSEMIERRYWKCTVPSHRHRDEWTAQACIDDHEYIKPARRWTLEMYADAVDAAMKGATLKEVGDMFGVGAARMRQVLYRASRMMRHPSMIDEGTQCPLDLDVREMRAHSDFWLGQATKLREKRYAGPFPY